MKKKCGFFFDDEEKKIHSILSLHLNKKKKI